METDIRNIVPEEDMMIKTFGQETEIIRVERIPKTDLYRCYIEPPVVVPGVEYSRNWVNSDEIQEYL